MRLDDRKMESKVACWLQLLYKNKLVWYQNNLVFFNQVRKYFYDSL